MGHAGKQGRFNLSQGLWRERDRYDGKTHRHTVQIDGKHCAVRLQQRWQAGQ
jgi:hypothetical protein